MISEFEINIQRNSAWWRWSREWARSIDGIRATRSPLKKYMMQPDHMQSGDFSKFSSKWIYTFWYQLAWLGIDLEPSKTPNIDVSNASICEEAETRRHIASHYVCCFYRYHGPLWSTPMARFWITAFTCLRENIGNEAKQKFQPTWSQEMVVVLPNCLYFDFNMTEDTARGWRILPYEIWSKG